MGREKGFTLIEIVMVIILLGILAAVAIPRFIDMSGEAKKSAIKGVLGGVRGGISIAHANHALKGNAVYPTLAEMQNVATNVVMSDGVIPKNPYATDEVVNVVDGATKTKGTKSGTVGDDWYFKASNGQFWSAQSGGVGANAF